MGKLKGGNKNKKEKSVVDAENRPFKKETLECQCHLYINSVSKHINK